MLKTVSLLGVNVSRVNLQSAVRQILEWVGKRERTYVCVAPAATLVEAKKDPAYAQTVNAAGMVTPDGMPVVWLARLKGCMEVARAYGPDLMQALCDQGQETGLKHYFYGATPETLRKLERKLLDAYPRMRSVGSYAPEFTEVAWQEADYIIDRINKSGADVLWVGLGSPKQDFWMRIHRPLLDVPVIIGAGAAFDFCSGVKLQAPRWMRSCGLEWLFRLCCEPGRLWKRYLFGNTLFVWYAVKDLLERKRIS